MNLKSIVDQFRIIKKHVSLSPIDQEFIAFTQRTHTDPPADPSRKKMKLLVEMQQDHYYLTAFSSIIRSLRKDVQLELSWINVGIAYRNTSKATILKTNQWYERKWNKIYRSMGGKIVFTLLYNWWTLDSEATKNAKTCFKGLNSKHDLINLEYEGIKIGDLIYDTYLRFKPAATVDLRDEYLHKLITHTFTAVKKGRKLFQTHSFDYLLTSYTTYIQHGVMTRLALQAGVKVISTGGHSQLSKQVTLPFPNHNKDFQLYKEEFHALTSEQQQQARALAKQHLEERFAGKIDLSTTYMRKSAYSPDPNAAGFKFKESDRKRVVLFLHCFFDSPHIYRKMIYPDFYEWALNTLRILDAEENSNKYDVYIKPHPNGLPGNEEIIESITRRFPKFTLIPKETSNMDLIKLGFDLALTVHGTLGHEFPYFGIPVLNAGDNPHINYSFSTHAETVEEYRQYLNSIDLVAKPGAPSHPEIFEFYYMHSLHMLPGKLPLHENRLVLQLLVSLQSEEALKKYMDQCERDPEYLKKIDDLFYRSFKAIL